ncbi:MAG: ArsA family ATPase [Nitrospiraceae bacterium]|nr:ArsA family ATPase [Nitrospiraceae bacterium]
MNAVCGLLDPPLKLILFGGKGGVGKTTLASCAAVYLASMGKKTLLISTDPAHSISDSLGVEIGCDMKNSGIGGLDAIEISAEKEFAAFKKRYDMELRSLFDTGSYLDRDDVDSILALQMPGMDEVMGLKQVIDLVMEGRYEKHVMDTAPTGHALRLLHLPELLDEWIKVVSKMRWKYRYMVERFSGGYRQDAVDGLLVSMKKSVRHIVEILKDHKACEFIVVTIPEDMAIRETARLMDSLKGFGIRVRNLIINNICSSATCPFCMERRRWQEIYIRSARERFNDLNIVEVPLQPREVKGPVDLRRLAGIAFADGCHTI